MNADGTEVKDGSCSQDDGDLLTAPSERPTSAQGTHQERAPPTEGGKQRGGWRSRSEGGGSCADLDSARLYSSDTKKHV